MSLADRVYLLLIASLPIVRPLNVTLSGHLVPFSDLIFIVAALAWIVGVARGHRTIRFTRFYIVVALYLLALSLSVPFSASPRQGIVKLLGVTYLAGLSVLTINIVRSWTMLRFTMNAWMVGTAVTAAGAAAGVVLFYAGLKDPAVNLPLSPYGTLPPGNYPRIRSLFANANMMCNYLNISVMFALTMSQLGWLTATRARVLLASIWTAGLSTLSPGIGGLFASYGIWTRLRVSSGRTSATVRLVVAGCLVTSIAFLAATLVSPATWSDPSERTHIWKAALAAFGDRPWFGSGVGDEVVRVQEKTAADIHVYRRDPHNVWLSVANQSGAVGLAAFLCLIVYLCRRLLPLRIDASRTAVVKAGLGLALVGALFYQGLSGSFEDARHLWVLMGLIVCVDEGLGVEAAAADARDTP